MLDIFFIEKLRNIDCGCFSLFLFEKYIFDKVIRIILQPIQLTLLLLLSLQYILISFEAIFKRKLPIRVHSQPSLGLDFHLNFINIMKGLFKRAHIWRVDFILVQKFLLLIILIVMNLVLESVLLSHWRQSKWSANIREWHNLFTWPERLLLWCWVFELGESFRGNVYVLVNLFGAFIFRRSISTETVELFWLIDWVVLTYLFF